MDSVRALAALSIFVVHAAIFSSVFAGAWYRPLVAHLDLGVTIFFLLSGFLLYRPFVAASVLDSPGIRWRDYARRRFLRIAPAYWVALTVVAIVPGLAGAFSGNWWVYYGLLQDYPVYHATGECAVNAFRCGIPPTWTLAVEVAFYAVLPFFALAMGWLRATLGRDRWFWPEIAALGAISVASAFIQSAGFHDDATQWLFFSPLGRAWWFAAGMGLAATSVRVAQKPADPAAVKWIAAHPGTLWASAAALYLAASLFWLAPGPSLAYRVGISKAEYVGEYLLVGVIALLILLPVVFGGDRGGWPRRLLAHPWLAWMGLVSYGIFLWHYPALIGLFDIGVLDWWPAMGFAVLLVTGLLLTLVLASLSYYLVERPLMRLKYRRREGSLPAAISGRNRKVPVESGGR